MQYIESAQAKPHYVYYILRSGVPYVGITNNLRNRLSQHAEKYEVEVIDYFIVPTRREAEGVEATIHQLMKQGCEAYPYICREFYKLHSLWFHSGCKGYPKHLRQKPAIRF